MNIITVATSILYVPRYGYERCGLMIAASYMLEKLKVDREVDVFQAVKQVRIPRPQLVTSLVRNLQFQNTNWAIRVCATACV